MPNQPQQVPNIDLPGAEYFSLAPNGTVALGGRRRFFQRVPPVAVGASSAGIVNNNIVLENPFTQTSGIYLHYFFLIVLPSAPGIQILNSLCGLSFETTPFGADYPLGVPVLTQPTLTISTVILTDRDRLVSAKDIFNIGGTATNPSILQFGSQVAVENTTAGSINVQSAVGIMYTRLDGFTE